MIPTFLSAAHEAAPGGFRAQGAGGYMYPMAMLRRLWSAGGPPMKKGACDE